LIRAYNELDEIPASVHPVLYGALAEWGFDGNIPPLVRLGYALTLWPGFTTADDTGIFRHFYLPTQYNNMFLFILDRYGTAVHHTPCRLLSGGCHSPVVQRWWDDRLLRLPYRCAGQREFNSAGSHAVDLYRVQSTVDLVANGTVKLSTLQDHVRKILGVKYDLGTY
jgi:hypothetical protein